MTLTGTVTRVEWMNPHVYFYIDVKDAAGAGRHTGRSRAARRRRCTGPDGGKIRSSSATS